MIPSFIKSNPLFTFMKTFRSNQGPTQFGIHSTLPMLPSPSSWHQLASSLLSTFPLNEDESYSFTASHQVILLIRWLPGSHFIFLNWSVVNDIQIGQKLYFYYFGSILIPTSHFLFQPEKENLLKAVTMRIFWGD